MSQDCACAPKSNRSSQDNPEIDLACETPGSSGALTKSISVCRRCGSNPFIILDKVHVECKSCFVESCSKKFRSTIGKTRLLRNNDPILVGYSGGPSSRALLELLNDSINITASHRQQKFRPSIIYVDTQLLHFTNFQHRLENLEKTLSSIHEAYPNWPIYWTTLEMSLTTQPGIETYSKYDHIVHLSETKLYGLLHDGEATRRFSSCLADYDLTMRQYFIQSYLDSLLLRVSAEINLAQTDPKDVFSHIIYGTSANRLAEALLTNVILGYGEKMRSLVSVSHQPTGQSVSVLRALRDFSKKELAFYLTAKNIVIPVDENELTLTDRKSSIQKITESFLGKLYVDYPSTYSTLLRTGTKMH